MAELTQEQIEAVAAIRKAAAPFRRKLVEMEGSPDNAPEYRRWVGVAIMHVEQGLMAAVRAVAGLDHV